MTTDSDGVTYFKRFAEESSQHDKSSDEMQKSIQEAIQYVKELNSNKETTHVVKFAGQKIEYVVCIMMIISELREARRVRNRLIPLFTRWKQRKQLVQLINRPMIGTNSKIRKASKRKWRKPKRMGLVCEWYSFVDISRNKSSCLVWIYGNLRKNVLKENENVSKEIMNVGKISDVVFVSNR